MAQDKQKTVMVVEDDKFLLKAYQVKLSNNDFNVLTASDGQIAVDKLQAGEKPHIILLDLIMPKKRGLEVLEEINKNPEWKKIPVIILTNLGQEEDINNGINAGAVDYIVKSNISMEEIIGKIKQHIL